MRVLGITFLLVGFGWIAYETTVGFSSYLYIQWIAHTQQLPAETVFHAEASSHIRDVCLALKDRQRSLFLPAFLMLIGGGLCSIRRTKNDKPAA